jgi:ABC-type multidrug transport system fused ATPase/permease subunit
MKKQLLFILAILLLSGAMPNQASAAVAVSKSEMRVHVAEKLHAAPEKFARSTDKKTEKRLNRLTKRLERKAEKFAGDQVDFSDPVEQWLWFGVFGLGIAIAFAILSLEFLSGLFALAAITCLVIWIIKRGAV